MLDIDTMTPWAWDARPFPWFPLQLDTWSDGENWHLGHWLTGRLGGCSLQDLVSTILEDYGYENFEVRLDGVVDGYIIPNQGSARSALEPLLGLHNSQVLDENGKIIIQDRHYADCIKIVSEKLIQEEGQFEKIAKRNNELELPAEAVLSHGSIFGDYEELATKSRRLEGGSSRQISLQAPIIMPESTAIKLADTRLREDWIGRQECTVSVPISELAIVTGDIIEFSNIPNKKWQVDSVERSLAQTLSLSSVIDFPALSSNDGSKLYANIIPNFYGQPNVILLDLPLLKSNDQNKIITHIVASATPWAGSYNVYSSFENERFLKRVTLGGRAVVGTLSEAFSKGPVGRWDYENHLIVSVPFGSLESVSRLGILNGANVMALESSNGGYELLQFSQAELLDDGRWKLSNLLRAQLGTESEMIAGTFEGANVVLMNEAVFPLELRDNEIGIDQNWRIGPARDNNSSATYINLTHSNNTRSRLMLSPAHLRSKETEAGHHDVSWIRRGTINADTWDGAEIPLGVSEEKYRVTILDTQEIIKRETFSFSQSFLYTAQMYASDFVNEDVDFIIAVAQLSNSGIAGSSTEIKISNT